MLSEKKSHRLDGTKQREREVDLHFYLSVAAYEYINFESNLKTSFFFSVLRVSVATETLEMKLENLAKLVNETSLARTTAGILAWFNNPPSFIIAIFHFQMSS